jgi:hypothetical protein
MNIIGQNICYHIVVKVLSTVHILQYFWLVPNNVCQEPSENHKLMLLSSERMCSQVEGCDG